MLQTGDFILITDEKDKHFLSIGKIIKEEYDHGDYEPRAYIVLFKDGEETYNYDLKSMCKKLILN